MMLGLFSLEWSECRKQGWNKSWTIKIESAMKQTTLEKLMLLYEEFQRLADELYVASEIEMENEDFDDASLLASQADKLYVEAENLMSLISELED